MYCPQCGVLVSNDWKVCPKCSVSLDRSHDLKQDRPLVARSPSVISESSNKVPSAWYYGIGAAIIVISFIVAIVLFVVDIVDSNPDKRFVIPGTHELYFDDTGKYTLFYEHKSSIDGRSYSTGEYLKGVTVSIESKDGSQFVPISNSSGNMTYEIGSRAGTSLFEFKIEEPGTYIVTTEYGDRTSKPEVVFAIGPSFDIFNNILRSFVIGFAGLILGGIVLVWVFRKRRKGRNKIT